MRVLFHRALIGVFVIAVCAGVSTSVCAAQAAFSSPGHLLNLGHGMTVQLATGQPGTLRIVRLQAVKRVALFASAHQRNFGTIPFLTRWNPTAWAAIKSQESHNASAPQDPRAGSSTLTSPAAAPLLRVTGMTDNGLICGYFGTGCQPPDMAVAASPNWTVQFVNTSIAIFDRHGVMVLGFPIDAPTFFGIPNPGSCTPFGVPFTTDPRAFFDPNDQRFFLAIGAHNGVADTCPFSSNFYIAASQTSDPTGVWNVYKFNADPMHIGAFGDFTQLGFDATTAYIGMNLFPQTSHGFTKCPLGYCWAQTLLIDKHRMENGASVPAPNLIFDYAVNGFPLDTVQPVETIAGISQQPSATSLISAANFFGPDGNGCFPEVCDQLYVFGVSKPLSAAPVISSEVVTAPGWTYPPNGDEPGCGGCVATGDSRISGQPIYSPYKGGTISFALGTGVRIGTLTWPGDLWGEVRVTSSGGVLTGASFAQGGYIDGIGVTNSYPDTMLTPSGSLFVVSDVMSPVMYPSYVYRLRRGSDPLSSLSAPVLVQPGLDSYFPQFGIVGFGNLRWGDYEAASYTGFWDNKVWIASQYPNTDYDWGTSMAEVK